MLWYISICIAWGIFSVYIQKKLYPECSHTCDLMLNFVVNTVLAPISMIRALYFWLKKISWAKKKADIGYWLAKEYWGKGVMGEAVSLVLKFAFFKLKFVRVGGLVFEENKASIKVLEKTGFKYEGKLRKYRKHAGKHLKAHMQ